MTGGNRAPRAIVFIDEIEKALAGTAGDTSGVSQDFLGVFLREMQDRNYTGAILIGPPGSGKSAIAKATGNDAGIPTIAFDLGAMKGSLVGESEARVRAAWQTIYAIGQGRVLILATCNSMGNLPPELKRRFTLGAFFFDLPTANERLEIWKVWLGKYGLKDKELPADDSWTGAEIRQCCDLADRLGIPLKDAAAYVVPVARSAADVIEKLRRESSGKYTSASKPGPYRYEAQAPTGRKVEVN